MRKEYFIIDNLNDTVANNVKDNRKLNELKRHIAEYIDRYSDVLSDIGMSKKIFFLNGDKEILFKTSGLTDKQIKDIIKQSPFIKNNWKILNESHHIAATLIIRNLLLNKNKKDAELVAIYYGMYFYVLRYAQYFPYGANENIMNYTINNLTNKYKIKQEGSLYKAIASIITVSHNTYTDELIRGKDEDIGKYVMALRTRINDFIKNIKNEYNKNHSKKNFLNIDSDDESDENYHISDNTSYAVERIANAALMNNVTYGADIELASLAANAGGVSKNEIRNVVLKIVDEETDDVLKLFKLILQIYLVDNDNDIDDINGQKFVVKSLELYKKTNTNDDSIKQIKDILDKWLNKYSISYRKTNRKPTLSNFRKAIYIYFVMYLQKTGK